MREDNLAVLNGRGEAELEDPRDREHRAAEDPAHDSVREGRSSCIIGFKIVARLKKWCPREVQAEGYVMVPAHPSQEREADVRRVLRVGDVVPEAREGTLVGISLLIGGTLLIGRRLSSKTLALTRFGTDDRRYRTGSW